VEPDRAAEGEAARYQVEQLVEPRLVEEVGHGRRERNQDDRQHQAEDDHQRERGGACAAVELACDYERRSDTEVVQDAEQADRE
jgi:hypothetical protein